MYGQKLVVMNCYNYIHMEYKWTVLLKIVPTSISQHCTPKLTLYPQTNTVPPN